MQQPIETPAEYEYRISNGIRYVYWDFYTDLQTCFHAIESDQQPMPSQKEISKHFQDRYGDDAANREARCVAAISWFEKHRDELDVGNISVCGEAEALLSPGLVGALWSYWCRDCCDLTSDPDAHQMIALAAFFNKCGDAT